MEQQNITMTFQDKVLNDLINSFGNKIGVLEYEKIVLSNQLEQMKIQLDQANFEREQLHGNVDRLEQENNNLRDQYKKKTNSGKSKNQ